MKTSLVMLLMAASVASADTFEVSGSKKPMESPRQMFFEAKLSPYTPLLDRPFMDRKETERPYYFFFGGGPMLLGEVEVDYQFFQKVGSLGVGVSIGYAEKFGRSIDAATNERVAQSTGISLVPIKALLVYRFDWLKENYHIPLVPYAKGAVVLMPWWMVNGGALSAVGVERAEGLKAGLAAVGGLALEIDFLDPRLARDFDSSVGVNHTYLFAEATFQEMNVFAVSPVPLDFSSRHFMFGLGFEF